MWVAVLAGLAVSLAFGPETIRLLQRAGMGQRVRNDGPQRHLGKQGTPTMGGVLIVGASMVGVVAGGWAVWPRLFWGGGQWLALASVGVVIAFAAIGFADDWRKVVRGRSLGLRAREKLALQSVAALVFVGIAARDWPRLGPVSPLVAVGVPHEVISRCADGYGAPGALWAVTAVCVLLWAGLIVFTSNAMNLADGLDGLAAGLSMIAAGGFAVLAWRHQRWVGGEVVLLALALLGACAGFLWFNRHPARMFMGDVGSLALGAAMGAMAIRFGSPLVLLGFCLVPFVEAGSVIVQVISFKTTGKRAFRMSPVHHHFELCGWSERRVVHVFWLVQAMAACAVLWWLY